MDKFHKEFYKNILLAFTCNGWNSPKWAPIMKDSFKSKKLKIFNCYLPCQSIEFETKFKDLVDSFTFKSLSQEKEILILERWTKKGFCFNRGCKSKGDCEFIIKYKVKFIYH